MPIIVFDRRNIGRDRRSIVDREFGDDYRDAHFPSGWYVLPLVGAGALVGTLVKLLF
jgi:hypothetical protein